MGRVMPDFDQLKEWVSRDWKAQAEWREQAEEEFAFVAGHQWSETERADIEEAQRVPIVFNRVAPIIASVSGSEINNRTEVRFIPREIGDVKPNEVLTAAAQWFRDQSGAEDEESDAFEDTLICGIGWTETTLDFDDDPEGQPVVRRIDPLEMAWDCHARGKGLQDAQRVHRVRTIPMREALDMFPDADERDLHADWLDKRRDEGDVHWTVSGDQYASPFADETSEGNANRETVTIVQTQWRERRRMVEYLEPETGQRQEMPASKWRRAMQAAEARGMPVPPHREFSSWVWRQAFLGAVMLGDITEPCPECSTFKAVTGQWDTKDKRFYGLLRNMKDPQKFANKWLSQVLHIINVSAKGGVYYETDATDDPQAFEENYAAADAAIPLRPGAISQGKIQERQSAPMPAALMNLTEFAISSIRDVSGVNLELLGLRDANQPGVLEYQRRQSAMTTLAGFFDALRFYRKQQGRVMLHFIRNYIAPTGRLVKIVKEEQEQYVPLAMDDGTMKYDVIVDDAPQAPNEKEKTWSVIESMLPLLQAATQEGRLGWDDWADIMEYSPLPSSFADKLREKAKAQEQNDPMQQQAQMLQLQKEASEVAENQAGAELDKAKAAEIVQKAGLETQKTQTELAKAVEQMMQDRTKSQLEARKLDIDSVKAQADLMQALQPEPQNQSQER